MVVVNHFPTDTDREVEYIINKCKELQVNVVLSTVRAEGGAGGEDLAREIVRLCEGECGDFTFSYTDSMSIKEKNDAVTTKVYGGEGITVLPEAEK